MKSERAKEVTKLTKDLMHEFYQGNLEPWMNALRKDSLWIASGEPLLYGVDSIKAYFKNYHSGKGAHVLSESYYPIVLSSVSYIVSGQLSIGTDENPLIASTQITFAYRYVNEEPTIAYQHMSYDYISSVSSGQNEKNLNIDSENQSSNLCPHMPMNATLRLYIRQLLNDSKRCKPVPAKVGTQVQYIDPRSILYLNSCGHKTTLYCVDRIIECSMNIHEFDPYLPENFYPLRRGCIINVMYITAIRRSEVELAFGTVIQIPVPSFPKVKMELNELILQKDFK